MKTPLGDHEHRAACGTRAIARTDAPGSRTKSDSPRRNAISLPSGDQVAEVAGDCASPGISGRAGPPPAGALKTPPRARKSMRDPSRDHSGSLSAAVVSPVSAIARPSPTGRTITCVYTSGPAAYATERPSGESAGVISRPGSQVTCVARPNTSGGAPLPPRSLPPRKKAAIAMGAPVPTLAAVRRGDVRAGPGALT